MDTLALILVIIGALNWGLVGLFQFDLVASLFGGMSGTFARIIYTLVGLAGVWGSYRRYNCGLEKLRSKNEGYSDGLPYGGTSSGADA